MLYASLSVLFLVLRSIVGAENDTKVVGSYIHELKIKPPSDLLTSASKKHTGTSGGNKHGDEGYIKSKATKDDDGYNSFDTFHTKDGDSFGYAQHFEFDKNGGDKKKGGYLESNFDEDEAADSVKPKFSEWNFEESSSPSKYYRYENDGEEGSKGKLVGPDYVSETKKSKKRPKRKKEQDAAATEYENYDTYGDIEEADDGAPADFEAEDADPEYGNQYADAEAYDYY